jgi:hypothetical protein
MKRKIGLLLSLVLLLAVASAALAGGWAVVTLDAPPGEVRAGEPWTVGFTVLQHGRTPVHGFEDGTPVEPLLVARNLDAGRRVEVMGTPTEEVGHFIAEVTFPVEGEWTWTILPNPLAGETAFEPLTVLPAAAPQTTGVAESSTALAAAPGLPVADGLRWGAVGVAGLAVVVALLQARKRAAVKAQAQVES